MNGTDVIDNNSCALNGTDVYDVGIIQKKKRTNGTDVKFFIGQYLKKTHTHTSIEIIGWLSMAGGGWRVKSGDVECILHNKANTSNPVEWNKGYYW